MKKRSPAKRWGCAALALILTLWSLPALAQQSTAEQAIDRFLELSAAEGLLSAEGQALRSGEALEWDTPTFGPLPAHADLIQTIDDRHAVARVTATAPDGHQLDLYFYLTDADGWRVEAMRTLAMTGLIFEVREMLRAQESLSDEEAATLRNLELTLSTDATLKAWFNAHRQDLTALVQDQQAGAALAALRTRAEALDLEVVHAVDGRVEVVIGGMVDNTVGFLKAGPDGPPAISPSAFIWIEALGDGWYLFRTT